MELIQDITSYCLEHSAEAEACDLLMEIEKIDVIQDLVSKDTHERVCLYLTRFTMHTHTHTRTHTYTHTHTHTNTHTHTHTHTNTHTNICMPGSEW